MVVFYIHLVAKSASSGQRADTKRWGDEWNWVHDVKFTNNIKFKENEDIKLRKKVDLGELEKRVGVDMIKIQCKFSKK